jgi:hypothetical protein
MIVENLVNLIGPFPNQCQLVLEPFRFGPKNIVADIEVGLNQMSVSIVGLHLSASLSGYFFSHFLVKLLDLLGELGAFSKLLSSNKRQRLIPHRMQNGQREW